MRTGQPDHRVGAVICHSLDEMGELGNASNLSVYRCYSNSANSASPILIVDVAEPSGRVAKVTRGGFGRLHTPQHGTQRRLTERLAQVPVGPGRFHDLGRVVLLPP